MSKSKQKVILLGPAHPYRGGLAAFNERLAYALIAKGYEVELVTFTLQYPDILFPGKTQYADTTPPEGLSITRRLNSINPISWIRTGLALRRSRAHAVIAAYWMPFMAPSLGTVLRFLRKQHTRRIGLVHNIIPHEKRPGDTLLSRYFTSAADGFMTLSDSVREELQDFSQAPARTAPHPVYDSYGKPVSKTAARQQLGLPIEGRYLLFFGFIRDYKGLDLLLRAMNEPGMAKESIHLIVAGEFYGNEDHYHQLIEQLGIADRLVLRTHFIADQEVRNYFCAADLVVQPYRTATQSGISQLAYHFDCPMVVTRVGGLPEIVPHGEAGYVVDQYPGALAEAILDFYQNERADDLKVGVIKHKQRFSWSHFVDQLTELF